MGSFDLAYIEDSSVSATSAGVVLTANSTPNTKATAYTTLIASTASTAVMMRLTINSESANVTEALIDIATGAISSEVNLIPNIKWYADNSDVEQGMNHIDIYVPITSGTRLSARIQAAIGSDTINVSVTLYSSDFTVDTSAFTTFGANTVNSRGSLIPDPGGSADTLPATWTEISSSLPHNIHYLLLSFGANGNTAMGNNVNWTYQLASGASSSEVVEHGGILVGASASEQVGAVLVMVPLLLSSGTRLSIRCQCNNTNAADRLLDVVAIGIQSDITAAGGGAGGIAHIVGEGGIVG